MAVTTGYLTEGDLLRRAQDYTKSKGRGGQKQVAHELGVSPNFVSLMLTGQRPITQDFQELLGVRKLVIYEIERELS